MAASTEIRVGPAGWNYKDWYGPFYPKDADKTFKELDYLAGFFNTAEINFTYYRPANAAMGASWVRKVSHNPDFKFTAKLWKRFTHERIRFGTEEKELFFRGIDPLAQAGKLGALLCQFPWSFKNEPSSREWLDRILDTFKEYPLVVDVRHASWDTAEFLNYLDGKHAGIAAIDQPVIGKSLGFKPVRTGKLGYVRLHGRNYAAWFAKKGDGEKDDPSARYDYLYSEKEIGEIADRVKAVARNAEETFVVQNNHPRGQAIANAAQVRASLGEAVLNLPAGMFEYYPFLKSIAKPALP